MKMAIACFNAKENIFGGHGVYKQKTYDVTENFLFQKYGNLNTPKYCQVHDCGHHSMHFTS